MFDGIIAASLLGRAIKLHRLGRNAEAYDVLDRALTRAYRAWQPVRISVATVASELMVEVALAISKPASARAALERAMREVEGCQADPGVRENRQIEDWVQRARRRLATL